MPEINNPPCPVHGTLPRALHEHNFSGIVTVIENIIDTISGVGTISYTRCPYGYPWNFEGVVRALEDLNASISGIAPGVVGGSGIYITESGGVSVVNADYGVITSGGLGAGTNVTFTYVPGQNRYQHGGCSQRLLLVAVNVQDTLHLLVSKVLLWYDTNQGRLFVYASGDWYQTNADALAQCKSAYAPSGTATQRHLHATEPAVVQHAAGVAVHLRRRSRAAGTRRHLAIRAHAYSTGAPIPRERG
jgi:hypothetical protein